MKELDKDSLLKEAKRRYPIGTKFKIAHSPENIRQVTSHMKHDNTFVHASDGFHINLISDLIKGEESNCISASVYFNGKWAEIVEEPKVETKFEIGKWYKNLGVSGKYIAKFAKLENNRFWNSEYIIEGVYHKTEGWLSANSNTVEIPLSEIQQYLPAGHPDLIKEEFVLPEKWCVKSTDEADETLIKWRDGGYTIRPAYLCSDKYWINEDNSKAYTEITLDQFKKYVLKQEVKEEVKSMEEWSVGSYAVAVQGQFGVFEKDGDNDKMHPLIKGIVFTITSAQDETIGVKESKYWIYKENCKWFPTLQEAQKFSDELLGKSKTGLRVEDLVEGEFYKHNENGNILKWTKNKQFYLGDSQTTFQYNDGCWEGPFSLATPSEVKWLNTCIKQAKFIPKEDLDKYDDLGNLIEVEACVKCNTEQEFDFAAAKLNCTQKKWFLSDGHNCINLDAKNHSQSEKHYKSAGYIIYSFDEWLELYNHKEAYEAQFSKNEKFKDGDWIVYIKDCGFNPSIPIKIGDIRQMIRGSFGSLTIYGAEDLSRYFRKALPWEIPVENSVKQNPSIFEDCGKFSTIIKKYITGIDPIGVKGTGVILPANTKKTPDLMDRTKVKVEIKRTKAKQIKL